MATQSNTPPPGTTRTERFAQFLRGAVAIKTKPVTEVHKYPTVEWFSKLPTGLEEVRSPLLRPDWPTEDPRWLVVARVPEPVRPAAPVICAPWLVGVELDTPDAPPALNPHFEDKDEHGGLLQVAVTTQAQAAWDRFLAHEWSVWAAKAALARIVKPIYRKLFSVHHELQGRADAYDLFIGVGLLDARTDPARRLRRHLLAFPAELTLDDRTGTISVGPAPDFTAVRLETDFLVAADRAKIQPQVERLHEELVALGPVLSDRMAVGDLLTRLTTPLSAVAQYVNELTPVEAPAGGMRVSFAPALILRPRSTRSLDELLARIQRDAAGATPTVTLEDTPLPWRKMMEDERTWEEGAAADLAHHPTPANGRVYFPLPSNDEQSRIVRFARGTAGVVVQGPPGTGKSHTIANLVSHYLATGQRVLVTAQTGQALEVLRDKMPAELQQLCVTLLGDTRESDKGLRRSVGGILDRYQSFDLQRYDRDVQHLEERLTASETELNALERLLHQARTAETQELEPLPGYRGTRAQIARRLRAERPRFAWLTDDIGHATPCPSSTLGWAELAHYHGALDAATRARLAYTLPDIPFSTADAEAAVAAIENAKAALPQDPSSLRASTIPGAADRKALEAAETWLSELEHIESEVADADRDCHADVRASLLRPLLQWRSLRDEATETLSKLSPELLIQIVDVQVSGQNTAEARRALTRLGSHYSAGGKRRHLLLFKPAVVKENEWVERAVTVDGLRVRTPEDVKRARRALEGHAYLDSAWAVWSRWPSVRTGSPKSQVAVLRHRVVLLERMIRAGSVAASLPLPVRQWLDSGLQAATATTDLLSAVSRRLAELALIEARITRDDLVARLQTAAGKREVVPAVGSLLDGLRAEDGEAVAQALAAIDAEATFRRLNDSYTDFIATVRALAPKLADVICAAEGSEAFAPLFAHFEAAWLHRRVQCWLDLVLSEEKVEAVHRAVRDERQRRQDLLSELTAARAWREALRRITDLQRASLEAWSRAVASIPATGLSVFRRRATAQKLLGQCLGSIPAWVVSLSRLYETVEATPGLFDVAIVDEASQCWLDSLVLFYLAKQVIVVGDDKQISPTVVGVSDGDLAPLASAFLHDLSFGATFTLESSLFDHARKYLSAGVPLREHFRCVPEIIRFSNELCYSANPLIPLRQVARNRLEPLKRSYLPDGVRTEDLNEVEARAIVDAILACDTDPAYDEATFGVICLQGSDQADRIGQLLVDRLGTASFARRRLRCGNPHAFQGDERDVMFLSMVAAPNTQNATLTTSMYEQRFNVAMSRARDQAWLFHSIQEDELGARCLRRRVLEFFKQPSDQFIHGSPLDIPALQLLATRAERTVQKPPAPFESWFEVDVGLSLVARGYTLSAQVRVAHKRIDLVVEGADGVRLAVECDGEAWHGVEEYEADMNRQRQLERAGWTFVRVRESLFYSDEARAVGEVIAACAELGLEAEDGRSAGRQTESTPIALPTIADEDSPSSPGEEDASDLADTYPIDLDEEGVEEAEAVDEPSGDTLPPDATRGGPFTGYSSKEYPDPRTAPTANVRDAVLEIVTADGPLPKESLYRLYRDGCPRVERAGKYLKQAINRAVAALERAGTVVIVDEGGKRRPAETIIRLASQDPTAPRPLGARRLGDVPIAELVVAMRSASGGGEPASDRERLELYRTVSERFGTRRLTPVAIQRLRLAEAAAFQ